MCSLWGINRVKNSQALYVMTVEEFERQR